LLGAFGRVITAAAILTSFSLFQRVWGFFRFCAI